MVNIFTCRCPNRSGVGAIDSIDLFEQVLDQRYITSAKSLEKFSRTTFRLNESLRVARTKCRGCMEKRRAYFLRAITLSFL